MRRVVELTTSPFVLAQTLHPPASGRADATVISIRIVVYKVVGVAGPAPAAEAELAPPASVSVVADPEVVLALIAKAHGAASTASPAPHDPWSNQMAPRAPDFHVDRQGESVARGAKAKITRAALPKLGVCPDVSKAAVALVIHIGRAIP